MRKLHEKLTKLASQFDKELTERDKAFKKYQVGVWDDIKNLFDTQSGRFDDF